jgi:heme/copper-type cytochrome/quinol oxidase subunit 2
MQIKRTNHDKKNNNPSWQKKNILKITITHFFFIVVLSAVIIAASTLSSFSQTNNSSNGSSRYSAVNNNIGSSSNRSQIRVFSTNSKPYGLTYGEWTAKWWQWGYSIPKNINPAYDDTGKNCAQKQNGLVWFLGGTFGHAVNRVCDIPTGKAIGEDAYP